MHPFRQSSPDEQHNLWIDDEADKPVFKRLDSDQIEWKVSDGFQDVELTLAAGNSAWIDTDCLRIYQWLAESLNKELNEVSRQFGEVRLPKKRWREVALSSAIRGVWRTRLSAPLPVRQ